MKIYEKWVRQVLQRLTSGEIDEEKALDELRELPYEDLDFAKLDHHRSFRHGFPEVVLAQGKTAEQINEIVGRLAQKGGNVLVTRMDQQQAAYVTGHFPKGEYEPISRIFRLIQESTPTIGHGTVLIISAGTADMPVALEAAISAETMGNPVERLFDVGVAGIHRLFANLEAIQNAAILIVVAGMEGALPSVVGGLSKRPIIAVPTSVGYGASFGGVAALLGMLNSCASGTVVVNIDNGFGAAFAATRINQLGKK